MRLRQGIPVLDRGDGTVQVGLARPAILTDLTAIERDAVATWEARATGWRPAPADTPALSEAAAQLRRLDLEENDSLHDPHLGVVRVRGHGALAREAVLMAARAGARAVRLQASNDASAADTIALTAHREVSLLAPGVRIASPFEPGDVEIHVSPAAPTIAWTADLMASDTPHVLVSWDDMRIVVGPAVVPGVSACARCVSLSATESDPWWPRLVLQLSDGRRLPTPRVGVATVATALAVQRAGEALQISSENPRDVARNLNRRWMLHHEGSPPTATPLPPAAPHSACGCGAPTPVTKAMISAP